MSLLELPQEVLDQIAEEAGSGQQAIQTLLTFALTCRSTVEAANRALYHTPLRRTSVNSRQALALLRALTTSSALAALVRDLRYASSHVHYLTTGRLVAEDEPSFFSDLTFTEWHEAILLLCPAVRKVSVHLEDADAGERCVEILAAKSSLESFALFLRTRESTSFELTSKRDADWSRARMDFSVSSLTLKADLPSLDHAVPFLPLQISHLHTLKISLSSDEVARLSSGAFLSALSSNTLHTLSIRAASLNTTVIFRDHHSGVVWTTLPRAFFSTFPHLIRLDLIGCAGLSVGEFELLAASSPAVKKLDLFDSMWNFPPDDSAHGEDGLSTGEHQLIDAFRRMPNLVEVDLGVPLSPGYLEDWTERRFEKLEAYCIKPGLKTLVHGYEIWEEEEEEEEEEELGGGEGDRGR